MCSIKLSAFGRYESRSIKTQQTKLFQKGEKVKNEYRPSDKVEERQ